jgi:hypothetical protein
LRLLDARADCTDAQLADDFLPLALQHCAPVAMELLALANEGATMIATIAHARPRFCRFLLRPPAAGLARPRH